MGVCALPMKHVPRVSSVRQRGSHDVGVGTPYIIFKKLHAVQRFFS